MIDGILDNGDPRDRPEDHLRLGRVPDLPDSEYRADPGISNSRLKDILESMAKEELSQKKDTLALAFGRAAHLAVFQPDVDLSKQFEEAPDEPGFRQGPVKNAPKWHGLAFALKQEGKSLLMSGNLDEVKMIAEAVRSHPFIKKWVQTGHAEVSYFAQTSDGIRVKLRNDWETDEPRPLVYEMKTAINAALYGAKNFRSAIWENKYHMQRVFYPLVMRNANRPIRGFEFLVPDKTLIPLMWKEGWRGEKLSEGVARYTLGKEMILAGEYLVALALENVREERRTGLSGYSRDAVPIGTDPMEDY